MRYGYVPENLIAQSQSYYTVIKRKYVGTQPVVNFTCEVKQLFEEY